MVWVHPCQKLEQQQKPSPSHASHARPLLQTARGRRIFKLLNIHWVWPPPSKSFKVKVNRTPQGYECNSPDSHWHPGGDHTQYIYIYPCAAYLWNQFVLFCGAQEKFLSTQGKGRERVPRIYSMDFSGVFVGDSSYCVQFF